jgi:NAD(P)-dependent dehydrogenase (short-subunit alcohol dehydrogenase family)
MSKRRCLLTGASGRLGLAFCRALANRYEIVAVYNTRLPMFPSQELSYIDPLHLDAQLPANVHRIWTVRADLRDEAEISRVVDVALARLGEVDLLVNAAGASYWGDFLDEKRVLDSWAEQSAINVLAPVRLTHELCMRSWRSTTEENRRHNRNVVNVSSTAGVFVYPGQGQSAYAASKAALNTFTLHLADELEMVGVRVNAVAPNSFPSIVAESEVVNAIAELDAGKLNGEILVVDADGTYPLE